MKSSKPRKKMQKKSATSKRTKKHKVEEQAPAFSQITNPAVVAQFLFEFGQVGAGRFRLPKGAKWADLYTKPVPANWGPNRLRRLLSEECQVDVEGRAFLFFNKAQDQLRLYFCDESGDQIMVKMLERGGFMFPLAEVGEDFIKVPEKKLAALFRST
jgi:hypothetical protein